MGGLRMGQLLNVESCLNAEKETAQDAEGRGHQRMHRRETAGRLNQST